MLRPWGSYKSIDSGNGFQVKWLKIKPGHRLSAQLHKYRSEHWVIVEGTASVALGEKTFELGEGESTFVPAKTMHRLENRSDRGLTVVEVQCGDYFGEDDIVRFADDYGRRVGCSLFALGHDHTASSSTAKSCGGDGGGSAVHYLHLVATVPFFVILLATVLIITYWPDLSLALVRGAQTP